MKQRLCLAKTLVHDPPVLILDEPASGLDPRARLEMKALLNELRGMGKTILVSSHILSELADFCTSIGIIERGKLLAAGSIQEIQRQLRSHRVLKVRVLDDSTDRAAAILRDDRGVRSVESYDHTVTAEFEGAGRGHGPAARPPDRRGRGGPFVRRGAAEPGGSVHDDHEGNRELKNFTTENTEGGGVPGALRGIIAGSGLGPPPVLRAGQGGERVGRRPRRVGIHPPTPP